MQRAFGRNEHAFEVFNQFTNACTAYLAGMKNHGMYIIKSGLIWRKLTLVRLLIDFLSVGPVCICFLILYVFKYNFFGHITDGADVIASVLQMPSPKTAFPMRKFHK